MTDPTAISHLQVAKMKTGNPIVGIVPATLDEVYRLATLIDKSGLAPKELNTVEKVTIVLLKGLEIGMAPMAALESFGVINGKACLYGDGIPALLWSHGFELEEHFEGEPGEEGFKAVCTLTRPNGKKYTQEFTYKDAVTAQLAGKDLYKKFPKRMYKMRVRGYSARDSASDVLKGMPIYEEQADIDLAPSDFREVRTPAVALTLDDLPSDTQDNVAAVSSGEDQPLVDEASWLEKVSEDARLAESAEELAEVRDQNIDMRGRLSKAGQARFDQMFKLED